MVAYSLAMVFTVETQPPIAPSQRKWQDDMGYNTHYYLVSRGDIYLAAIGEGYEYREQHSSSYTAADNGRLEVTKLLLSRGANIEAYKAAALYTLAERGAFRGATGEGCRHRGWFERWGNSTLYCKGS